MKLRVVVFPVLVLLAFLYSGSVIDRASEHGAIKLTKASVLIEAKKDLAKFHPSSAFIINK